MEHEQTYAAGRIVIIAGPNGAGKTTFAEAYLKDVLGRHLFINADLIAAELSPGRPETAALAAGRIMLGRIDELAAQGTSFGFETTLSGKGYAKRIPTWRAMGYMVSIVFLRLPSARAAIRRVRTRVSKGGHAIPDETVIRRFHAGLANYETLYKPLVDYWSTYDNSGIIPRLVERMCEE